MYLSRLESFGVPYLAPLSRSLIPAYLERLYCGHHPETMEYHRSPT
nr:spore germination protein [Paenibacillus rhizosphaerae]